MYSKKALFPMLKPGLEPKWLRNFTPLHVLGSVAEAMATWLIRRCALSMMAPFPMVPSAMPSDENCSPVRALSCIRGFPLTEKRLVVVVSLCARRCLRRRALPCPCPERLSGPLQHECDSDHTHRCEDHEVAHDPVFSLLCLLCSCLRDHGGEENRPCRWLLVADAERSCCTYPAEVRVELPYSLLGVPDDGVVTLQQVLLGY